MLRCIYKGIGKHKHKGELIVHGDIVELTEGQYQAFKDRFDLLDEIVEDELPEQEEILFVISEGRGIYNVYNRETGKKINDSPLTKADIESSMEGYPIYKPDDCPYSYEKEEESKAVPRRRKTKKRK